MAAWMGAGAGAGARGGGRPAGCPALGEMGLRGKLRGALGGVHCVHLLHDSLTVQFSFIVIASAFRLCSLR